MEKGAAMTNVSEAVVVFIGAGEDYGPLPDGALVAFTREGFWGLPAHAVLRTTREGDEVRVTVLLPVYSRKVFKLSGLEPSGKFLERGSFTVACRTPEEHMELDQKLRSIGWRVNAIPPCVSFHGACAHGLWVREALS
jgi:hypothetical protein